MRYAIAATVSAVILMLASSVGATNNGDHTCQGNAECVTNNVSNNTTNNAMTANGGTAVNNVGPITNTNTNAAFGGAGGAGGTGIGFGGQGGSVNNDVRNTNNNTDVNVNDLSNRNDVNNTVRNRNSNRQSQGQVQGQSQRSTNKQSQSANNEGVNVDASDNSKTYAYGHSGAPAALGTDGISVGTIFGGIGLSQTSTYAKTDNYITRLVEACKAGIMDEAECKKSHRAAVNRLEKSSKRNDRGLFNLFGLL